MALVTSRTGLSQGAVSSEDVAWTASSGANTILTGTGLPVVELDDFFEIRYSPIAGNNGLYIATGTPTTSSVSCTKVNGADPIDDASETVTWLGDTTTYKSVFFDCAGLGAYILEQGNVSADGVVGQAIYSFCMQEWKDDSFLIANAPMPMLSIDSDAGKYIIGQNASGNYSGWNWVDNATHSIRTRKLLRNMGWDEVDVDGNTIAREIGIVTLGVFRNTTDTAFYSFGSDTTVDNTTNFTFSDAVNEAVRFFEEQAQTDLDITATTITRIGGSFITEGYKVGGQVTIRNAEDSGNDGTFVLTAVEALVLTTTGLTVNADDTAAILAVDNDNAITLGLRVRDATGTGNTFSQATLATIDKTSLGNFVYPFPLANGEDLKIPATIVDGDMAGAPYTGMSITYHDAGQSRGGLVGGPYDFSIIVEGNSGTAQQIFYFIQYQLRQLTDIDDDGDIAIGRAMDLLARYNGEILEVGSADGGLNFPYNPDSAADGGVFIDNVAAADANNVKFYDDTGAIRSKPETIAVTLDFNQTAIDDVTTEYDLFYDRTIRTLAADLDDFVLTNATSKITSATTELPTNSEIVVGSYIRISGLTGDDEDMNGVYQISVITTPGADWTVSRYDNATIVDVAATGVDLDQNCIDTPDHVLVHTNVVNTESGSTITYTSPDTISDSANGFGAFTSGDIIQIEGSTSNDGFYEVDTAAVGSLTTIEQTLTTEASSSASLISKCVSGLADVDESFSYDFDGNVQGGRTVSTDTYVKAKAVGSVTAQYTESTIQTIESGTPLTIPLVAQQERNYA